MSKIGKLPIDTKGTTITIVNRMVTVAGTKGSLSFALPQGIQVAYSDDVITVSPQKDALQNVAALFGLVRAKLANMVKGVNDGFEKKLEMTGVGYRAQAGGSDLTLSVGFSHPVKIPAPKGIQFAVVDNTILVKGIDKDIVGDVAAKIRAIRPPEPYKGKGIRYLGERIRRKAGKAAKAVGGK